MRFHPSQLLSTYSILAFDPLTGHMGGAVQTHQMGVGRILPIAAAGYGVIASQSLANLHYNSVAIQMLKEGYTPEAILKALIASDSLEYFRQVAVMDSTGRIAAHTGKNCIPYADHFVGEHFSVQANMMTRNTVIPAMRSAYENATGDLAHRMLVALQAAQSEDGDIRGMQSAALIVVSQDMNASPLEKIYDIRVDESAQTIQELGRLLRFRYAQLLDEQGNQKLADHQLEEALALWRLARETAPELEEIAYWQALTLADELPFENAIELAVGILRESVQTDERWTHWLELIKRLHNCGFLKRQSSAQELLAALESK